MLIALKHGNHKAFADVFDAWKHKVYHYFLKKTEQPELAKDLTQYVFLKLWKYRHQISDSVSLDQQIFQKARQVYIDWLKKEATFRQHFDVDQVGIPTELADHQKTELRSTIAAAIETLPEKRKKIFELKHVYGYSYKEISEYMGISVKTVDSQLLKALTQLRKTLTGTQFVFFYILFYMQ